MRRHQFALSSALAAVGLSAGLVSAQQPSPTAGQSQAASVDPADATFATRPARYLLRNGLDYLAYREYDRALNFFRSLDKRQDELNPAERQQLKAAIAKAQAGKREASNSPRIVAIRKGRSATPPGAFALATPAATAPNPVQLTSVTLPTPAAPAQAPGVELATLPPAQAQAPGEPPPLVPEPAPGPAPAAAPAPAQAPSGLDLPVMPAMPSAPLPDLSAPPAADVPMPAPSPGPAPAPIPLDVITPASAPADAAPAPVAELPALPSLPSLPGPAPAPVEAPVAMPEPAPTRVAQGLPGLPPQAEAAPAPAPAPEPPPAPEVTSAPGLPPLPVDPSGGGTSEIVRDLRKTETLGRGDVSSSLLSPMHREEVERIAQRPSDVLSGERGAPGAAPDDTALGAPVQGSTRLELPRAPSPTEARPLRRIPVPEEFVPIQKREWDPARKYWAAAGTCHMTLYFQDPVLERYGQGVEQSLGPMGRYFSYPLDDPKQSNQRNQILQPFYSIGKFCFQVGTFPYKAIMDPPGEAEYDLGYYRPGDKVPTDTIYITPTGIGPPLQGRRY